MGDLGVSPFQGRLVMTSMGNIILHKNHPGSIFMALFICVFTYLPISYIVIYSLLYVHIHIFVYTYIFFSFG